MSMYRSPDKPRLLPAVARCQRYHADYRTNAAVATSHAIRGAATCIDHASQGHYIGRMNDKVEYPSIEQELARLEGQVGKLLEVVERLTRENRSLRTQQESLTMERAGLLEKHDQVRNRVDAIVTRLKSMETGI
jgi:cell division protein ZapB